MCFCQYLMSPWPPSFSLAPSPTSYVDIIYDHLPCSDCQVHLALTITEVWLRKDNSPVAIRLLLEQAGTSFGLDKPHQMLSIAPAAQGDVLPPFSSTDRIPFTDQSLTVIKWDQVMPFACKFGLEFSFNSELFVYRVLCCVSRCVNNNKFWCCLHLFALLWQKLYLAKGWRDCWPRS